MEAVNILAIVVTVLIFFVVMFILYKYGLVPERKRATKRKSVPSDDTALRV